MEGWNGISGRLGLVLPKRNMPVCRDGRGLRWLRWALGKMRCEGLCPCQEQPLCSRLPLDVPMPCSLSVQIGGALRGQGPSAQAEALDKLAVPEVNLEELYGAAVATSMEAPTMQLLRTLAVALELLPPPILKLYRSSASSLSDLRVYGHIMTPNAVPAGLLRSLTPILSWAWHAPPLHHVLAEMSPVPIPPAFVKCSSLSSSLFPLAFSCCDASRLRFPTQIGMVHQRTVLSSFP